MDAVRQFLEFIDQRQSSTLPPWTAHQDGTRDMVRQGKWNDCGLATCYIIEATAQDVALSYFTEEGIYQSRARFALCLLTQSVPPISTAKVTTVQSVVSEITLPPSVSRQESVATTTPNPDDYHMFHKDFVYFPYLDDADMPPEILALPPRPEPPSHSFITPSLPDHCIAETY